MTFATPVSIVHNPKINEWLSLVEKEMRVTLAKLLAQSVQDMAAFRSGTVDSVKYIEWVDKYQVGAALVCLQSILG